MTDHQIRQQSWANFEHPPEIKGKWTKHPRDEGITKQGRRELRKVLVEAPWITVNSHPYWKAQFDRLTYRKPRNKAIVAIARKFTIAS